MNAFQIIFIVLQAIGLLISANKHGKEKTTKENFWESLMYSAITFGFFYWAGFFDN